MCVYSILDTVAESWSPPFIQENDRAATRTFTIMLRKSPESAPDMQLFRLGSWTPSGVDCPFQDRFGMVTQSSLIREAEDAQG